MISIRIRDRRGYWLTRNAGHWSWTLRNSETHYFTDRDEAQRVQRRLPAMCQAHVVDYEPA